MVRYGILGFGHHAEKRLMPAFASAHKSRPTAFWRNNQALAADTERRYGVTAHSTIESLCRSDDVDAVFLTSPDALHLEHAEIAFAHGKPVLCEKPMAMTAEQCERMIAAAERAHVPLAVAHVMRFQQSVNTARDWIASGRLGDVLAAKAEFTYPGLASPRIWITDAKLACGGPTGDVGVHCFDTLRYVLQYEVTAVYANTTADEASGAVEASASIQMMFSRNAAAHVFVTTRAPYRTYLEVIGTQRTLECRNAFWVDGPVEIVLVEDSREVERATCDNSGCYAAQFDAFADTVRLGTPFPCTAQDGLKNQRIIDAAYASARTGRRIALPK
ncbi:MAG: Gfo/Idh/MocA family oxidoreductase [Acidobacteriaceae bacterium]